MKINFVATVNTRLISWLKIWKLKRNLTLMRELREVIYQSGDTRLERQPGQPAIHQDWAYLNIIYQTHCFERHGFKAMD